MAMDNDSVRSLMKSLMLLFREVLDESGTWCHTSTDRDYKTVSARVENEGLSFLTITLPTMGLDLQKALSQGKVDPHHFLAFAKSGSLPRLLGGFFDLIFDRKDGRLLDNPSIDSIRAILQLTRMYYKMELKCTPERETAALEKYVECEKDVRQADRDLDQISLDQFKKISSMLYTDVLNPIDRKLQSEGTSPKHGPGSTAEHLTSNGKYLQNEWTTRLEQYFPFGEYACTSWSEFRSRRDSVVFLEPGQERPVRVILVPKTLKTPRVIAIEPTCMQYVQQGLMAMLYEGIEQDDICSPLIGFTDQIPNQEFAREGSLSGELATLDLSEASDRVSNQHVLALLRNHPTLSGMVQACRSRKADVPGHGVLRLAKFASMGSALCFPIEAMVFLTIIFLGIQDVLNRPLTMRDLKSFHGKVRVYGDDIIVPVEFVSSVVMRLETFGFRVNTSKSFSTGKYRESCGKEYYDGVDVSQVRVRHNFPTHRKHVDETVSLVSLRNQLFVAGYLRTCETLDTLIEGIIPFPFVSSTSPALGKHGPMGFETHKMCSNLHRPLVRAARKVDRTPSDLLDGYGALMKWFLKKGIEPFVDKNHLIRAGRANIADIKIGWNHSY